MLLYKRRCLSVCRSVGYPSELRRINNIVSTQFLTDIIDSTQHVGALGQSLPPVRQQQPTPNLQGIYQGPTTPLVDANVPPIGPEFLFFILRPYNL